MAAQMIFGRCSAKVLFSTSGRSLGQLNSRLIKPSSFCLTNTVSRKNVLHTSSTSQQLFTVPMNRKEGASHWFAERGLSVALLVLLPVGCIYPHPLIDWSLAPALSLHTYWGVNAIIADYTPPVIAPAAKFGWKAASVLGFAGLLYINFNDVGLCKILQMMLKL